ncbi:hypothetical protein Pmani_025845, partial [Petrolisthes manimaculis]
MITRFMDSGRDSFNNFMGMITMLSAATVPGNMYDVIVHHHQEEVTSPTTTTNMAAKFP